MTQKHIAVSTNQLKYSWDEPYVEIPGEIVGIEKVAFGTKVFLYFEDSTNLPWNVWSTYVENLVIQSPTPTKDYIETLEAIFELITEIRIYQETVNVIGHLKAQPNKSQEKVLAYLNYSTEMFERLVTKKDGEYIPITQPFTNRMLELRELTPGANLKPWGEHRLLAPIPNTENPNFSLTSWQQNQTQAA